MQGPFARTLPRFHARTLSFQRAIARWFAAHQRDLPWRRTRHPYEILVSEVMLQQTQVDRVIPKYRQFLRRFPTVKKLAKAAPRDVLLLWTGMGYNRRALYLHRLAREVMDRFGGVVPTDPTALVTLPGVGAYTAHAVATFATGIPHPLVDTNVRRVTGRIFGGHPLPRLLRAERGMRALVERTMPLRSVAGLEPSLWGHALMDFGALVCKAKPRCEICPVRSFCRAYPTLQNQRTSVRASKRASDSHALTLPRLHAVVPDRIYRGNILKLVCAWDPKPVPFSVLQPLLVGRSARALPRLIRGLVSDGLLTLRKNRTVSLPVLF